MVEEDKTDHFLKRGERSNLQSGSTAPSSGTNNETFLLSPILLHSKKSGTGVYKFHVFMLLTTFLNICYYCLLVPFRFTEQQKQFSPRKQYVLQTNIVQTTLSSILVILITLYSLSSIYDLYYWNMEADPKDVFIVADEVCGCFLPILWFITFWINRKHFAELLVFCQGENLSLLEQPVRVTLPKTSSKLLINIILVLAIIKMAVYSVLKDHYISSLEDVPWLSFFFIPILTGLEMIKSLFDVFCVIGAVIVHQVCSHFSDQMEKLSDDKIQCEQESQFLGQSVKKLSIHYMDLVAIAEIVNEIFGTTVVLYYMSSCPSVVWMIFALFEYQDPLTISICVHEIALFAIFNAVASNGSNKVHQYKQWLFKMSVAEYCTNKKAPFLLNSVSGYTTHTMHGESTAKEDSSSLQSFINVMHRQVNTEDVALKGYKFFAITYSLIGTMLGFVVTFATVMYQFDYDKKKPMTTSSPTLFESNNVTFADENGF